MAHPGGRPKDWTDEKVEEVRLKIEKYISETDLPIVAEFAYQNDIRRATLYDIPELAYTLKKLIEKKETALERKGLSGEYKTGMAVFSLKQLGWTDKVEVTTNQNEEPKLVGLDSILGNQGQEDEE